MGKFIENGRRYQLTDPVIAPKASSFLWNRSMMLQMTCRGYATAQFMQPEPAKYAHGPTLAAKTFMQPEHPYFAHHPGRFFYIKDKNTQTIWSAPYEPTRTPLDSYKFEPGLSDIRWVLTKDGIEATLSVTLAPDTALEIWSLTVKNLSDSEKTLSIYPYFPVGYSSWMNMSANYDSSNNAVVAQCITPYQRLEDYPIQKDFKDLTFLASAETPSSWSCRMTPFEGEGGLHNPDALKNDTLDELPANYELPACIQQHDLTLSANDAKTYRFLFGPAQTNEEVTELTSTFLNPAKEDQQTQDYQRYVENGLGTLKLSSPDSEFNDFVNQWLPRQLHYHGDSQRLSTDPQTRNFLQDAMGMAYLDPEHTKQALIKALSQQKSSGQMPDGILLTEESELKYINKIPHTDHGVWLILCLQAYLNETADEAFLNVELPFTDTNKTETVFTHIKLSLDWLLADRDERGLSYIAQGDWCDPMNMVGHKGKGVSAWLTQAVAYALTLFIPMCDRNKQSDVSNLFKQKLEELTEIINSQLWDGQWYIRGITDDNRKFGSEQDDEGKIFLNTQSWALLAGVAPTERKKSLLESVTQRLDTPYGPMMSAPAFTYMHEDIGRVTQKYPGAAENGSVYNHASMFWCAALFASNERERAFDVMHKMLSFESNEGLSRRGQLPIFIPNYYRGAFYQNPDQAGFSSHLFNTGTVAWYYRLLIENLAGFTGTRNGINVQPFLPNDWPEYTVERVFRGCTINLTVQRDASKAEDSLYVNNELHNGFELTDLKAGSTVSATYIVAK